MEETFHNLTTLIKNHDDIIIMAHAHADLDALGSALAFYTIIDSFHKRVFICLDRFDNASYVGKALEGLDKEKINISILSKEEIESKITESSLLIILDTHKREMLEYECLLDKISDVILIDHHIKNVNYIKNTKFSYHNSNLSSIVEFSVNYLKYLNKVVHPFIATIMLAGMEVDTNGFNIKTTEKTFAAASYLMGMGADNIMKQELKKEDKTKYDERQNFVRNSYMINDIMAMCTMDDGVYEKPYLAMISEELLQFEGVEASFTIGYIDSNIVGVSARSIGNVDVESVMRILGGGGHATNAAAQIKGKTILGVKREILKMVNKG